MKKTKAMLLTFEISKIRTFNFECSFYYIKVFVMQEYVV